METIKSEHELFRADIARGIEKKEKGIDRDKGIIYGYAVMTKGAVKDSRGWEIDDITLDQLVKFGNKSKIGIKSRFGHPNMSSTALGSFLGRAKKFRKEEGIVRADLYLDKTAYDTPNGDLATYVLDLAESDPDAFGSSIVFDYELEYRIEKDGTPKIDPDTKEELPPLLRIKKLFASDIVDDPAANDGMFGTFFTDSVKLSAETTAVLDRVLQNKNAVDFIINFLMRYQSNRNDIDEDTTKTSQKKEGRGMEFNELTVEVLKKERPELFESIKKEALEAGLKDGKEEGIKEERARTLDILKDAKGFKDVSELAFEAIEKGSTKEQALISFQQKQLKGLQAVTPDHPGPNGDANADSSKLSHIDKAKKYQAERGGSMTDALRATAEPRKK